jgi:hypothetical protein
MPRNTYGTSSSDVSVSIKSSGYIRSLSVGEHEIGYSEDDRPTYECRACDFSVQIPRLIEAAGPSVEQAYRMYAIGLVLNHDCTLSRDTVEKADDYKVGTGNITIGGHNTKDVSGGNVVWNSSDAVMKVKMPDGSEKTMAVEEIKQKFDGGRKNRKF